MQVEVEPLCLDLGFQLEPDDMVSLGWADLSVLLGGVGRWGLPPVSMPASSLQTAVGPAHVS